MKPSGYSFKLMALSVAILALLGGAIIVARTASAQSGTTYNAVNDFSLTQNPNGVWSYGYTTSRGSNDFTVYPNPVIDPEGNQGIEAWRNLAVGPDPQVSRNTTGAPKSYVSIVHPPDMLTIHPGPQGQHSVVRWTAPAAGTYRVAGRFEGIDTHPTTTDVSILHNSTQTIFLSDVNSFGGKVPFDVTLTVEAGDRIDLSVGRGSNDYTFDSTGLAATITPVAAGTCITPPSGMVAWYRAEGNANDEQGVHNATLQNGATFAVGKVGQAFNLDGTDDIITAPDNNALNITNDITIDAWINPTAINGERTILSKRDQDNTDVTYVLFSRDGQLIFSSRQNGSEFIEARASGMIPINQFTHVAISIQGTTARLYINGVEQNATLFLGNTAVGAGTTYPTRTPSDGRITIGAAETTIGSIISPFAGLIDEASIHNRALSQSEIQAIVNAGSAGKCNPNSTPTPTPTPTATPTPTPSPTPTPTCVDAPFNLVHWYRAENNATDSIGGAHGSITGGVTYAGGFIAKVGSNFSFDGATGSVTTGPSNLLNNLPVTIEAWVRPDLRSDGTDFPANAISNDVPNNSGQGFGVNVFAGGSQMKVAYSDGVRVIPAVSFQTGVWYHVVVEYKTGRVRTVINGVEVDDFTFTQGSLNGAGRIYIGKHNDDTGFGTRRFFKGQIDEVSIYTGFLPLGVIRNLYNADSLGKCNAGQAPPNNHIQNVHILNQNINSPVTADRAGHVVGANVGATRQIGNFLPNAVNTPDEPLHHGQLGGKSVWYAWSAPYRGSVKFETKFSSFDTLLAVYAQGEKIVNGVKIGEWVKIASNDDHPFRDGLDNRSRVRFTAAKGVTYYIAVDGSKGATGTVDLTWELGANETPGPVNSAISALKNLGGEFLVGLPVGVTAEGQRTVVVIGRGFASGSQVLVNGEAVQTTFRGDSTKLEALIPSSFFEREGDIFIRVRTGNEIAANTVVLQAVCLDIVDAEPGQTFNTSGPGAPQIKPPAQYKLQGTNTSQQKVRIAVTLTPFQQAVEAVTGFLSPALTAAGRVGDIFGTASNNAPPPAPGKTVGGVTLGLALQPKDALGGLKLSLKPGTPVTGTDAASLIGQDGASLKNKVSMVAAGAGNLIGQDGASLIGQDGSSLIGQDGSSLVGHDGSSLIGLDGGSLISRELESSSRFSATPSGTDDADEDTPVRRIGWYVFRDAQGGNGSFKTVTEDDGSVYLEAEVDLAATALPRVADLNRTKFAIVLDPSYLNFAQNSYTVSEGAGALSVTVRRTNNTAEAATVIYQTTSRPAPEFGATAGTANDRSDYTPSFGTLFFLPGETEKTFTVLITDDGLGGAADGATETFNILLNNAAGAAVDGTGSARVTINDNDAATASTNPVSSAEFFVRQHYYDFLNREPDAAGLAFWANQITSCGSDAACIDNKRQHVSAAFFLSIEFQETGYLLTRINTASFGVAPPVRPLMQEFLLSTQAIGRGVVVGQPGWDQKLQENQNAFLDLWVDRPDFLNRYAARTNAEYVNDLFANTGVAAGDEATLRNQLIAGLSAGTETRATVLRKVAESRAVSNKLFNPAFVQMQYFGYLRRNPNDAPDGNFEGFNFWLNKLNQFGGDYIRSEMVRSFILASEYCQRFGQN